MWWTRVLKFEIDANTERRNCVLRQCALVIRGHGKVGETLSRDAKSSKIKRNRKDNSKRGKWTEPF